MSFHVGEIFGDYEIIAIIGAGSMGQVYQVEHRITKRKEAVKVLSTELATDTQVHRFEREIAIQAQLHHPNIATAHNALRWKGQAAELRGDRRHAQRLAVRLDGCFLQLRHLVKQVLYRVISLTVR